MAATGQLEEWLGELTDLEDDRGAEDFLRQHPELHTRESLEQLSQEVLKALRQDRDLAERLARASHKLAEAMNDDYGRGLSAKSFGNIRYLAGHYEAALKYYHTAVELFRARGLAIDAAVTLSSSIHAQILLGRYDDAFAAVSEARAVFEQHDERLLLARLDSNEAQIFMRQDRLAETVKRYERVLIEFRQHGEPQDIAAALYNIAVCRIGLSDFPQALAAYEELSDHCARHQMRPVAAQADYNVAYLYFLRGEYMRALELYRRTRDQCDELGDPYHRSLCDLDQAEIHLELNLTEDGARLANLAFACFEELGNGYEAAKAVAFQAIAASQQHTAQEALKLFDQAHERFQREGNGLWLAMIDLYRALILEEEGRLDEARQLAERAMSLFVNYHQVGKVALCELLLARIELAAGDASAARERCLTALQRLEEIDVPASTYQAYFLLGQAEEALDEPQAAIRTYRRAHERLENLRSHLRGEELKIAFLKDKHEIYESLVWMTLANQPNIEDQRAALLYIEQAKSRSLADLVAFRADALPGSGDRTLTTKLRQQRDDLNWTYRQIDLHEIKLAQFTSSSLKGDDSQRRQNDTARQTEAPKIDELRRRCREQERRLLQTQAELRSTDAELSSLQAAGCLDLEVLQAAVPEGALLLEYYEARGTLFVGLLGRDQLAVRRLGDASKVRKLQHFLQFQLSKFQLTPDYLEAFGAAIYRTALAHLENLYTELIAPIRDHLETDRLIIVPHGGLHYLPFHALWDGEEFLLDRFVISYAPSASVFAMCCAKPAAEGAKALVLGVPDELTPHITGEVEAVAASLPNAELLIGEAATAERLRALGPKCRQIHIATHGFSRFDNPMFSAIQLGTSRLTLFDLYDLELEAELVVLSGCATGVNVVESGDELIGLTRGLLFAGARSALVTLWDVNDASTAHFMTALYRHLEATEDRAEAVRQAMLELRQTHPHPYYWAPFVLIGKPSARRA